MNMRKSNVTRRRFLEQSASGIGTGLALRGSLAPGKVLGANDRIRIGAIGTGGRTQYLMQLLKKLSGNEMVAVCDVYEPRLLQAAQIAGQGAKLYGTIGSCWKAGKLMLW